MAEPYRVHVEFRGICAHFHHNVLGDVAHRVVLPDAAMLRVGHIARWAKLGHPALWREYALMPHFAQIGLFDPAVAGSAQMSYFASPTFVSSDGLIFTPSRITVSNAIRDTVSYEDPIAPILEGKSVRIPFLEVPALSSFLPDYQYSTDVVRAGRAAAYFDIQGGFIGAYRDVKEIRVYADIPTDGPPEITIAPMQVLHELRPATFTLAPTDLGGTVSNVIVANSCPCEKLTPENTGASADDFKFDFLLHFLTHTGGIPRAVHRALPGAPPLPDITQVKRGTGAPTRDEWKLLRQAAKILAQLAEPSPGDFDLNASCSDSRYP